MCQFLLGKYIEVEFLDHRAGDCLILWETARQISKMAITICALVILMCESFHCSISLLAFGVAFLFFPFFTRF